MIKRTTFSVTALRKSVNHLNATCIGDPNIRKGWNELLDYVLSETGNHLGFKYLMARQMLVPAHHQQPGVSSSGKVLDETRRYYA